MKYFVILLAFYTISANSLAQDGAAMIELVPPGPHLDLEETEFNFDDIQQGEKVAHTFKISNDGDAPLVISNVLTTCGCTASNWPREPILPGDSSQIDVTFDSTGKVGHQNKVITIMSNASNNPAHVKIVVNILPKSDS